MVRFEITRCPSKLATMMAFFDKINGERRSVQFTVSRDGYLSREIEVVINQIGWEDGSGDSWNFKGYIPGCNANIGGWFRTDRRIGWVELPPAVVALVTPTIKDR